jgi:hypothetical protein
MARREAEVFAATLPGSERPRTRLTREERLSVANSRGDNHRRGFSHFLFELAERLNLVTLRDCKSLKPISGIFLQNLIIVTTSTYMVAS